MAVVMITHDLGVVAELADDVLVMYGGRIVESAQVDDLFEKPEMPYTWGLLGSMPRVDVDVERLEQIPGQPPSLLRPPSGCAFNPRCAYTFDRCRTELPELRPSEGKTDHHFRCHLEAADRARIWAEKKAAMGLEKVG
jgi:peptide/nickel transport system ATP-binding protein